MNKGTRSISRNNHSRYVIPSPHKYSIHTTSYEEFILNKRKVTIPTPFAFDSNKKSTKQKTKDDIDIKRIRSMKTANLERVKDKKLKTAEYKFHSEHHSPDLRIRSSSPTTDQVSSLKKSPIKNKNSQAPGSKKVHFVDFLYENQKKTTLDS